MLGSISVELLIDFLDKVLVEGKMPKKSTMEPLSCVRQLVRKYREKRKKALYDVYRFRDRASREVFK